MASYAPDYVADIEEYYAQLEMLEWMNQRDDHDLSTYRDDWYYEFMYANAVIEASPSPTPSTDDIQTDEKEKEREKRRLLKRKHFESEILRVTELQKNDPLFIHNHPSLTK